MPRMPTFIVIGAPKAGTTALYHYLQAHPAVYMSPVKETTFFRYQPGDLHEGLPDKLTKGTIRSLAAYQALFADITDEQEAGEVSPQYFHSPLAAENIKKHLPEAKIIAILRHPVDRAYSQYMMHMNAGRAAYRSFEAFFRENRPHREGWGRMPYDGYGLARSFYYQGLRRYYDLFPREQIRVYRSDDLKAHLASLLNDLYGFIGVDATFQPDLSAQYNVGGGMPKNQELHRVLVGKSALKAGLKRLIPTTLWHLLHRVLLQQTRTTRRALAPAVRDEFFEVYREDVLQTQALTGIDLSLWFPREIQAR